MASVSLVMARNGGALFNLGNGAQTVTAGTDAPAAANTIEMRVDLAAGWTRKEVIVALERFQQTVLGNADIPPA